MATSTHKYTWHEDCEGTKVNSRLQYNKIKIESKYKTQESSEAKNVDLTTMR